MSITGAELRSIIHESLSGNQFSLLASRLHSDAINAVAENCFPDGKINLSNVAAIQDSDDGKTFTAQGTGVDPPFTDMPVTIRFYLIDNDAAFDLTATGDSGWTLKKSFPLLAKTLADSFSFKPSSPPRLYLRSHASEGNQSGMSFEGTLDLSAMTGGLASLVGRSEQPLSGALSIRKGGRSLRQVEFTAPVSEHVNLGVATVNKLAFKVGSHPAYNFIKKRYSTIPYIKLSAEIPFSDDGQRSIPVAVEIADLSRGFRFSANLTQALDAGLEEVSKLTKGVGLGSFLPKNFHLEDVIKLDDFFFDFNPGSQNLIDLIGVGIQSTRPWTVTHLAISNKDLQVDNVNLTFQLQDPLGAKRGWLSIGGELVFGSAGRLVISAFYPHFSIGACLKKGTSLRFDEIIKELISQDEAIPKIDVHSFSLSLAPNEYSAEAVLAGDWPIGDLPIIIREVALELSRDAKETKATVTGQLRIADVDVFLSAKYLGADGGWEFEGSTGAGQEIPIGKLIQDLANAFGAVTLPPAIADLKIEELKVSFNTHSKHFLFTCHAKFPIDDKQADISVTIDIEKKDKEYTKHFGGLLTVGALKFQLDFSQDQKSTIFVATYTHTEKKGLGIKGFVALASSALAQPIPESLEIDLKDVIFAYSKGASAQESKFLFGLDIGTGVKLSDLPLVGQKFPPDQTVGVDNLQLLVASKGLTRSDVASINELSKATFKLPESDESSDGDEDEAKIVIKRGLTASATMKFGNLTRDLSLPVSDKSSNDGAPQMGDSDSTTDNDDTSISDNSKWFKVQKSFGPVYFEKVGVQYKDNTLSFLLTASLSVAGLTLELDGLSVGSGLSEFKPQFDLHGIGIDYKNGPVEISGAFLRKRVGTGPQAHDEYAGRAMIKTEKLTLTALGSYMMLDDHPSLFVYALLDYPIGGPSFFFVTGLSAGFGYNRSLLIPPLEKLTEFPLIAEAITRPDPPPTLEKELQSLQQYLPPTIGQHFFAIGIKFTSFKMIESFALLTVAFGRRFEIDLLGISTLTAPTPDKSKSVTPVAVVSMAIRARFVPDEGFLSITGQLTSDSYILSKDCHLTGGFAFYSWFGPDHKDDFVQTLGGYHPNYTVPDHYPKVPRVGLNWRVNDNLAIKGQAYYALIPSALMAGGHLQATWESGDLKVWFNVGADFLIAWKPYHYEATAYVNIRGSYTYHLFGTHHIDVDVGADLKIWGPEFAGKARIDLAIFSIDIEFGPQDSSKPKAIDWATFKESFLPPKPDVCGISIKDGLVSSQGEGAATSWVVNPKQFSFVVNSVIPAKEAYKGEGARKALLKGGPATFGIGSVEIGAENLSTTQTITITRDGEDAEEQFTFTPIFKDVPAGMWGTSLTPSLNGQSFIEKTLAGFEISPAPQPQAGETADIDVIKLLFSPTPARGGYDWQAIKSFDVTGQTDALRRQDIADSIASSKTAAVRDQILQDLGVTDAIDIAASVADAFSVAPQVGVMAD